MGDHHIAEGTGLFVKAQASSPDDSSGRQIETKVERRALTVNDSVHWFHV